MNKSTPYTTDNLVDHLFRTESGKMTAILTQIFGFRHSTLVEDIIQETFLSALKTWPLKGLPDNPSAWLMQVAKNKAINAIKRQNRLLEWNRDTIQECEQLDHLFLDHQIKDSQLRMLFACCYPELPEKSQIMLMLKTMSGFSNAEIASALLMTPTAVKKAISRAKSKVQVLYKNIAVPVNHEAKQRLKTIYTGLYLMFSEGYKRSCEDEIISEEMCFEAIRLTTLLLDISDVNHGKTHALLSLMYFDIARFPARKGNRGEIIDLKFQDRTLWDKNSINAGFYHLQLSRESKSLSKFHLESSIASIHCLAVSFEKTNWNKIISYYQKLLELEDSDIIRLNFAIALSQVKGAEAGLRVLDEVSRGLPGNKEFMLYAAKAKMNADLGRYEMAKSYYQVACDMAVSKTDKKFFRSKKEECDRNNLSNN